MVKNLGKRFLPLAVALIFAVLLFMVWQTNVAFTSLSYSSAEQVQEWRHQIEEQLSSSLQQSSPSQAVSLRTSSTESFVEVKDVASYQAATGRLDRVYCMIPTMYEASRLRLWSAILKTYGSRCDIIKFFVDPSTKNETIPATFQPKGSTISAEIVVVPMRRRGGICADGKPCRHIWEKVWRSWLHVFMHDLNKAEWFVKVDDDTYFLPSNLRKFVREKQWAHDDPHYFGYLENIERPPYRLVSGVCTTFSRGAISRLGSRVEFMKSEYGPRSNFPNSHGACVDRDGATEELVTSKCLSEVGVYAEDALEDGTREYVIPLGIPFTLTHQHRPGSQSWFWKGKTATRGVMRDCCSAHAWGIHGYKHPDRMFEMEGMMTGTSREEILRLRDHQEPGTLEWEQFDYVHRMRVAIANDRYAYPPMSV